VRRRDRKPVCKIQSIPQPHSLKPINNFKIYKISWVIRKLIHTSILKKQNTKHFLVRKFEIIHGRMHMWMFLHWLGPEDMMAITRKERVLALDRIKESSICWLRIPCCNEILNIWMGNGFFSCGIKAFFVIKYVLCMGVASQGVPFYLLNTCILVHIFYFSLISVLKC
jgi:hypothetical protein